MDRRVNPTPAQILAEIDRLIERRHMQRASLQKLRPLLISQLMLFAKIGRRYADRAAGDLKK